LQVWARRRKPLILAEQRRGRGELRFCNRASSFDAVDGSQAVHQGRCERREKQGSIRTPPRAGQACSPRDPSDSKQSALRRRYSCSSFSRRRQAGGTPRTGAPLLSALIHVRAAAPVGRAVRQGEGCARGARPIRAPVSMQIRSRSRRRPAGHDGGGAGGSCFSINSIVELPQNCPDRQLP